MCSVVPVLNLAPTRSIFLQEKKSLSLQGSRFPSLITGIEHDPCLVRLTLGIVFIFSSCYNGHKTRVLMPGCAHPPSRDDGQWDASSPAPPLDSKHTSGCRR